MITSRQLEALGVPAATRDKWVMRRRLMRLFRGAYLVGAVAPPLARETAALLLCGPQAALSHRTAAWLHGLVEAPPAEVHVTVEGRQPRSRPGIAVHTTPRLEVHRRHGLPVTTPARTIVDLAAAGVPSGDLDHLIQEAHARRRCTTANLRAAIKRATNPKGIPLLNALLEGGTETLRSDGERALRRLVTAAGLPEPQWNVRIGRWTVDAVWPEAKLIVELDGHDAHASPWARDRDAQKTAELQAAGWRVLRITGRQLVRQAHWVVAQLAALVLPAAGIGSQPSG